MANFQHSYFSPNKELLCMRCADLIAKRGMKKGEIMGRYNERIIEIQGKDGQVCRSVLILCPNCIGANITEQEMSEAKKQIIGGFDSLLNVPGIKKESIDSSKKIFEEGEMKDLKSKNEVLPEA